MTCTMYDLEEKAIASCTHDANQRFKSNTSVTLNQRQLNEKKNTKNNHVKYQQKNLLK